MHRRPLTAAAVTLFLLALACMGLFAQQPAQASFLGFDRNGYPGDAALPTLHNTFAFTGYWLNVPPGEKINSWRGHRNALVQAGFGFLVLFNGRLDRQLQHGNAAALGTRDGEAAVKAAHAEGFPAGTLIFLDMEEGGRMLPEQAAYLFAWATAVRKSDLRPGVYCSGQPVDEGHGVTITTAADIRAHQPFPIALWVAQDACPPAPGCTTKVPALALSGTSDAVVWQFAQSPRRPEITRACAATYGRDGNCHVAAAPRLDIDLNVAATADPSSGR